MQLEPYLSFNGNCEEALKFYAEVFSGEVTALNRFAGSPMEHNVPPEYAQKIMHANFKSPSLAFMASDGMPGDGGPPGNRVSLSLATRETSPKRNASSERSRKAVRSRCRSRIRSGVRSSECSPTNLASIG